MAGTRAIRGSNARTSSRKSRESLARRDTIILRSNGPDRFEGHPLELPAVRGHAATWHGCYWGTVSAATNAVRRMVADGRQPPQPVHIPERDQQFNIRLTADEKLRLESLASRDGFRAVSHYVRSAALGRNS